MDTNKQIKINKVTFCPSQQHKAWIPQAKWKAFIKCVYVCVCVKSLYKIKKTNDTKFSICDASESSQPNNKTY